MKWSHRSRSTFTWIFTSICHINSQRCPSRHEDDGITDSPRQSGGRSDSQMYCLMCVVVVVVDWVVVRVAGAHHYLVHWLSEPHLLLVLCLPGRERRSRQRRLLRVRKLRRRPVVGSGKSVSVCVCVMVVRGLIQSLKSLCPRKAL